MGIKCQSRIPPVVTRWQCVPVLSPVVTVATNGGEARPVSAWERGMGQGRAGDPPPPTQMDSSWGVKFRPAAAASQAHPCCLYSQQHQHQPRTRSALYTRCYERAAGRQIDDKTAWPSPICYDQQAVYKFIERAVTRSKVSGGGRGGGNEMNRLSIHYGIRHVNLAPSYPPATIQPLDTHSNNIANFSLSIIPKNKIKTFF